MVATVSGRDDIRREVDRYIFEIVLALLVVAVILWLAMKLLGNDDGVAY